MPLTFTFAVLAIVAVLFVAYSLRRSRARERKASDDKFAAEASDMNELLDRALRSRPPQPKGDE